MKQRLILEYDIINKSLAIVDNDFTTIEAFGILEGAKQMISAKWMEETEAEEIE